MVNRARHAATVPYTSVADLRAGGLLWLGAPLAAGRVSSAVAENHAVLRQVLESG